MIPPLSQPPQAGHDPGSVEEAAQLLAQAVMGLSDLEDGLPGPLVGCGAPCFEQKSSGGPKCQESHGKTICGLMSQDVSSRITREELIYIEV